MRQRHKQAVEDQEVQETIERNSVLRGLVLLVLIVLLLSFWRAGLSRVFYTHWWQQW